MSKLIIGICGEKRSGKDTIASVIKDMYPLSERIAFGDALKEEIAYHLAIESARFMEGMTILEFLSDTPLDSVEHFKDRFIEEMNTDDINPNTGLALKEDYRTIMQWYGTEFKRNRFSIEDGYGYWIDEYIKRLRNSQAPLIVTPDVRYDDECDYIQNGGGLIIRVIRNSQPKDSHSSEQFVPKNPNIILENNSSLDGFKEIVKRELGYLIKKHIKA